MTEHHGPARILVADDDADLLDLLVTALQLFGYAVESACDGREALDVLTSTRVDLAVLDVLMPRMTGLEVIQEIRTWPEHDQPAIMVLSATLAPGGSHATGLDVGDDFLPKPFTLPELRDRIHGLLESRLPRAMTCRD